MRRPALLEVAAIAVVVATTISWFLACGHSTSPPLGLIITAAHYLPVNHKLGIDDLRFSLGAERSTNHMVTAPREALGACTRTELKENEPVSWDSLVLPAAGDASCASVEIALDTLSTAIEMPSAGSEHPVIPAELARRLVDALTGGNAKEAPPARSAPSEFPSEFLKELGKRLADNAGDRIFGRDRSGSVGEKNVKSPGSGPQPPEDSATPEPHEFNQTTYFDINRAVLGSDQLNAISQFAIQILGNQGCQTTIHGYADRTGLPRDNLWLSQERANAVASILVARGIDRRSITVIPHGDQETVAPASGRRVETYATCKR
jgi:outer membrane protein OmpA-like peptidoglycan-associated protein